MTALTPAPRAPLFFPFQFVSRNVAPIARRIWLPCLVGALSIYGFFSAYMWELQAYLSNPQDSVGSRVLGIAALALLVLVFLHSLVVARIAQLALGLTATKGDFLGVSRAEWRLYTANLQFCILVLFFVLAFFGLHAITERLNWPHGAVVHIVQGGFLFWLAARLWFLLPPVCVTETRGEVLLAAWRRSAGHFWRIALLLVAVLLTAYLVQAGVGMTLHAVGLIAPLPTSATLAEYVSSYRENLLPMVVMTNIAYIVFVVLTAAASAQVYAEERADVPPA
ncbi:hypothetical protein AYO42_03220 [Rhizomicrobium sp. SCGC AG-212-E05]|nr:hypothetical protein AYO42_03220 [Rhizomicrobium sp. SCGC AG-212-E05]